MSEEFKYEMMRWDDWSWSLQHFLRIRVIQQEASIFVHQDKYAQTILENFGLKKCKPLSIPLAAIDKLILDDGSEATDEE